MRRWLWVVPVLVAVAGACGGSGDSQSAKAKACPSGWEYDKKQESCIAPDESATTAPVSTAAPFTSPPTTPASVTPPAPPPSSNSGYEPRPSSPTGWTDAQRNLFLSNCAVQAVGRGASVQKAASICDCTLAEIEVRYSPADAVSLSNAQLASIGAKCS
jgi:hypothetical protein